MEGQDQNGERNLTLMDKYATPKEYFKAMNIQPIPLPKMNCIKYDIPGGSKISVILNSGKHFTGTLLVNPSATANQDGVSLIRATEMTTGDFYRDVLAFYSNEIKYVSILQRYKHDIPKFETCMPTFVVSNAAQMDSLVDALKGVDEVAMSFHGRGSGRYGNVTWIALCIKENFIPIDVVALDSLETKHQAWVALKKTLFENENIIKIVHDARPISDFLYNKSGQAIAINNIFDTQICDLIVKHNAIEAGEFEFKGKKPAKVRLTFQKLDQILHQFIPECVLEREIALMMRYHAKIFRKASEMQERPLAYYAKKYMALTVKYLPQLKKELTKRLLQRQIEICDAYTTMGVIANMAEAFYNIRDSNYVPDQILKLIGAPLPPISVNTEVVDLESDKYNLNHLSGLSSVSISSSTTDDEGSTTED